MERTIYFAKVGNSVEFLMVDQLGDIVLHARIKELYYKQSVKKIKEVEQMKRIKQVEVSYVDYKIMLKRLLKDHRDYKRFEAQMDQTVQDMYDKQDNKLKH